MNYYDVKAQEFIDSTFKLDLSDLYNRFEPYLKPGARILDIGCGPGRDLKYFSKKYIAEGIEPSASLAAYAKEHSGCVVHEATIQDFYTETKYDGLWACASLLHIPKTELSETFKKLSSLLNPNAPFYLSFKYGDFEGERNGRFFNDQTEESIKDYLYGSNFSIQESWISTDIRSDRNSQKWLNLLLRKPA